MTAQVSLPEPAAVRQGGKEQQHEEDDSYANDDVSSERQPLVDKQGGVHCVLGQSGRPSLGIRKTR